MIIFGTRGIKSTIKKGDFNCPQCQVNTNYRHRKVRRFFTLYFTPVIPLDRLGEYVECGTCKGTFVPRVLEDTNSGKAFLSVLEEAIRHSMILIMLADGEIDANEKEQTLKIINKFSEGETSMQKLDEYIKEVELRKDEDLLQYLSKVEPALDNHGKESIIKCAITVAAADGKIDNSELKVIDNMGKALKLTSAHLKGIFGDILESRNEAMAILN